MVALELQRALKEEIQKLTSEMRFKTPKGKYVHLNVFEQNLPTLIHNRENDNLDECYEEDEEILEPFPYCVVKLDSGKSSISDSHLVKVIVLVGIFEDSVQMNGYKDILNIFEDIRGRFRKNAILDNKFRISDEISWALPDEDKETFPYFYGAMYMEWITAEFEREDEFA